MPPLACRFLAADIGFVNLNDPGQFGRVVPAGLAEPLEHEPGGLLRDADLRVKLDAADALAGRDKQIHRVEPLVQRYFGSLENGPGANGEIEQTSIAAVEAALAGADAIDLATRRAGGPVRPALRLEIGAGALLIGEHLEQLECAYGGLGHGVKYRVLRRSVPVRDYDREEQDQPARNGPFLHGGWRS